MSSAAAIIRDGIQGRHNGSQGGNHVAPHEVTPSAPLAAGEYCFFNPGAMAAAGASATGKLFDFGVDGR